MSNEPEPTAGPEKEAAAALVGREAFLGALRALAGTAHLNIALLSHALDARVYGDAVFVEKIQAFALRDPRCRLRVLVNAPEQTMRQGHRLVELGRRLSSRLHFRQLPEDQKGVVEEYLIIDEKALLHRDAQDRLEARHHPYAPMAARRQLKIFDALWEESLPAREFSELRL